jgi:hypothetical protein
MCILLAQKLLLHLEPVHLTVQVWPGHCGPQDLICAIRPSTFVLPIALQVLYAGETVSKPFVSYNESPP